MRVLNYQDPAATRGVGNSRAVKMAALMAVGGATAVNTLLVVKAAADKSWGAFGIAIAIAPVCNCVLALLSLAFIPLVRKAAGPTSIKLYVLTGIFVPITAMVVDAMCIFAMDLRGC